MAIITKIEIIKLNIPYKEPFVISLGVIPSATNVVVKLHSSDGLIGIGECAPFVFIVGETQETVFELSKMIGKMLKGKDPYCLQERLMEIEKAVHNNYTMKSAFDMALYDLAAKKAKLPLYQYLGGSNNREIFTDMTISIGSPEKVAADAKNFMDAGFPAIKVKLGTNLKDDVARIKAIREVVGGSYPIRIDANQGWDVITAIKTLKALDKFNIEHCEEPIPAWNYLQLPKVRQQSPIPIMADESLFTHYDAMKLAKIEACDYFNIKFSKSGGINTALKINSIAESAGIKCQVGCMSESRYALTALMHFVLACPNVVHYDIDSSLMLAEDPVIGGIEYQGKGQWKIGDSIGIGADYKEDVLANSETTIL
ncbi:mandelate racemase/muconate lactonizing enzyme family protein [Carboxylicivirga caseinilyticus]|uniref:mandelate racemase/muconate lactonizing enzyme family protein n=1 Tax=Carboxylicivirga caseinilyticus TaxID=3417572 RepID=UPI003D3442F7|nr:dipeptide epimerase [Marinilabiliaceae bacterium A049]